MAAEVLLPVALFCVFQSNATDADVSLPPLQVCTSVDALGSSFGSRYYRHDKSLLHAMSC